MRGEKEPEVGERIFIGIGSNIGDSRRNCLTAIRKISNDSRVELRSVSSLYTTSPVSLIQQDHFINCAVEISWQETPEELLRFLNSIEASMGRVRNEKDGPRVIDLDILLYGNLIMERPNLVIPHAELHRRKFAIIPCIEIDPDIVHPSLNRPLRDFLSGITNDQQITKIEGIDLQENDGP